MASWIIIRLGELTLKGHNRGRFEDAVFKDMESRLRSLPQVRLEKVFGRVNIELNGTPFEEVASRLDTVFGIHSYCPAERCALDPQSIRETALQVMRALPAAPRTFKVKVRRPNKKFPIDSMEMNHVVGGYVLANTPGLTVDVHHPEVELHVEIRNESAFVYCHVYPGLGGYPRAISGRGMLLLSGGIDSPVAGFLAMKRGLELEAVHFHSYPYTSERAQDKVKQLARQLAVYSQEMTLHMVPFTDIQTRLKAASKDKVLITLIRRAMMRITSMLAMRRKAGAIITGESLGQVASQTLESLTVIGEAAGRTPVLRPLIMMDKAEIIEMAHRIGTYPISILPYEDCCTLFVPKSPTTRPNPRTIEAVEAGADWLDDAIEEAIRQTERFVIRAGQEESELSALF